MSNLSDDDDVPDIAYGIDGGIWDDIKDWWEDHFGDSRDDWELSHDDSEEEFDEDADQ